jgi:hypothetical protein
VHEVAGLLGHRTTAEALERAAAQDGMTPGWRDDFAARAAARRVRAAG